MTRKSTKLRKYKRLEPARKAYDDADTVNYEDHPSFTQDIYTQAYQMAMTSTLENAFYMQASKQYDESVEIYKEMLDKDPDFLAKLAVFARNRGYMRIQPILITVGLTTLPDKTLARLAFPEVMRTPDDVIDFVELSRGKVFPGRSGLGTIGKELIVSYLTNLSKRGVHQYYAIKYPKEMTQLTRLSHPKPEQLGEDMTYITEYLATKWKDVERTDFSHLPQINGYLQLKQNPDKKLALDLINKHRLPHEAVTGVMGKMDSDTWKEIARSMPIFALTRHLATFKRNDLLRDREMIDIIKGKLENKDAVKKSMMFPFRFWQAYSVITDRNLHERSWGFGDDRWPTFHTSGMSMVEVALINALETAIDNVPKIEGRGAIAVDVSGSMAWQVGKSNIAFYQIAGIFAHALQRAAPKKTVVFPFDTNVHAYMPLQLSAMDTVNYLATVPHGGTDCGVVLQALRDNKVDLDWFIGITDNEEWYTEHRGYRGSKGAYGELIAYRELMNPNLKFLGIRIDPYKGHNFMPRETPNAWLTFGWSDAVVRYGAEMLNGGYTNVELVNKVTLGSEN